MRSPVRFCRSSQAGGVQYPGLQAEPVRNRRAGLPVYPAGLRSSVVRLPGGCVYHQYCTVTNKADRKTRNTINRAIRLSGKLESLDIRSVGGSNSQMTPTAPDRPNSSKTDTGAIAHHRRYKDGSTGSHGGGHRLFCRQPQGRTGG
jgi:hypothetical protein